MRSKPYYGEAAGDQLTELLKQHIVISVDLVVAAKEGNATALSAADATWYQNADDIVTFLSTANPNLNKDEMKAMYDEQLKLTTNDNSRWNLRSDSGRCFCGKAIQWEC